jgi:hypothetical protein
MIRTKYPVFLLEHSFEGVTFSLWLICYLVP